MGHTKPPAGKVITAVKTMGPQGRLRYGIDMAFVASVITLSTPFIP